MLAQNCATVFFDCATSGNSRPRWITTADDARDTARRVFRGNPFDLRIGSQETPALIERHRVRLDGGDRLERRARTTDQTMTNRNDDFTNDVETAVEQQIERGMYKACETVFDGRQDVVGALIVDRRKERFESRARDQSNLFTKKFHRSLFAESSWRALEGDAPAIRRQLQSSFTLFVAAVVCCASLNATRLVNDGAEEFDDRPIVQRAFVGGAHPLDHFALARVVAKRKA